MTIWIYWKVIWISGLILKIKMGQYLLLFQENNKQENLMQYKNWQIK